MNCHPATLRGLKWVAILLLIATCAQAQRIRGYNFTRSVELSEENIQFRVPVGANAETLQPPEITHGIRQPDGARVEMFLPLSLWRAPQRMGHWRAANGNEVRAAIVTTAPPDIPANQRNRVYLREECDKMLADAGALDLTDNEHLMKWAEAFAEGTRTGPLTDIPDTISLRRMRVGTVMKGDNPIVALFVAVKPGMHGADPNKLYAFFFGFGDKPTAAEASTLISRTFPGTIQATGRPQTLAGPATPRPGPGGGAQIEESPERKRSRDVVLQTIRGLPKWWSLESERYIIVSDLSGTDRSFVQRLSANLNQSLRVYESLIPPMKPIEAVSAVRVFADSKDYLQYVGPGFEWSGGMWDPSKLELIIRISGWQTGQDKRESLADTVQHAALHQYLFYAFPGTQPRSWYSQGHASFMQGVELTPRGPRIGETDRASSVDLAVANRHANMGQIIRLSHNEFHQGGGTEMGRDRNYALAWGLIYYLRKGAPDDTDPRFSRILPRYEAALREGKTEEQAHEAAFDGISAEDLNTAFLAFWNSPSRRAAARQREIAEMLPTPAAP